MLTEHQLTELLLDRSDVGQVDAHRSELGSLPDAHVRMAVERWALTANTVTYAKFGDMLAYWDFYPSTVRPGWGKVPSIGYGRVIESAVDGIDVGGRYFCWYPQATSVDLAAVPTSTGFRDDGAHRAPHATPYRQFLRTDVDSSYTTVDDEDRHLLLRGLYLTGFLIDSYFAVRSYLGAEQALVMSASSKTALGFASAVRSAGDRPVRLIGVTSASNVDWVMSTGLYDSVCAYDELASVESAPSIVVDMAGASAAVAEVHRRLGDLIACSMIVGKSHHDAPPAAIEAGPAPEFFFAPTAMADGQQAWGDDGFARRTREGIAQFIDESRAWLQIERVVGVDESMDAWRRLHAGEVGPGTGVIASLA
jgi:hypothetical protein